MKKPRYPKTPVPTKEEMTAASDRVHNAFLDVQIAALRDAIRVIELRIAELEAQKKKP